MGRRRSHERRDLPPNLYIRNNGYYCYRDPRTGKEFGLGRDRRIAITEAIQANIELFSGHKHKPLTARINSDNSVTLHSWLDRYEKILASRKTKLKTIRNNLSFLRSAIDEAVTDGLLTINPVTLVSASRYHVIDSSPNSDDYEVDPFTPAEISAIYQSCSYPEWENLFRFAFNTGLRSSELCALRWPDLDNIAKTAHVQAASVVGVLKGTKTKAGTRKVELNSEALAALQAQKQFTFMKSEFIFSDPKTGEPWANADAIRKKAWVPTLKKAGVRYRNPYQTRHTFATRHISQGVNLFWLAGQMGHKGPEMLFRNYGKYLAEYDGKTAISAAL